MLPPKHRRILGCFALSENIWSKNLPPLGQITYRKYNKNFFQTFENIDTNFKKQFRIEIWTFSFQINFWNPFLTLESGQMENMKKKKSAATTEFSTGSRIASSTGQYRKSISPAARLIWRINSSNITPPGWKILEV